MKPLYTFSRRFKPLYRILYLISYWNHEMKFTHRIFVDWSKAWDFFFVALPVLFLIRIYWGIEALGYLVAEEPINYLFLAFQCDKTLFTILPFSFFVFARLYQNSFKTFKNEEICAYDFHNVNHKYRNFVNKIIEQKKLNSLFVLQQTSEDIRKECIRLIKDLCIQANESMSSLINDPKCYTVIKLLQDQGDKAYVIRHYEAFPDRAPNSHLDSYVISKENVDKPSNLFQLIIDKFREAEKEGSVHLWALANDLKGHDNFDSHSIKDKFKRYKSCIIIPITINYAIRGFLCFNSTRIGKLRKKHSYLLSGYCDVIANLFRNILLDKS